MTSAASSFHGGLQVQPAPGSTRIAYLDWTRGLACLLMFQSHGYDSWLGGAARDTVFFRWTRFSGAIPAPIFLFLAGVVVALVADRAMQKGVPAPHIARATMRRGAQIFGLALLFRLQEFLLGQPRAPWTDLLRVDVLNIIGLSLVLLGALYAAISWDLHEPAGDSQLAARLRARLPASLIVLAVLLAAAVALVTPPLWTTYRPRWLPWYFETYVNGVHRFDRPQAYLFPLFPWAAFAFAGLAAGCFLVSAWARRRNFLAVGITAAAGAALFLLGLWFDSRPRQLYAVYDFWHTSPNFFLMRIGLVTGIMLAGYAWCRWVPALWGFSPVVELGRQSLLVYWVHIPLAYGGLSILKKRAQDIPTATAGVIALTLAMIALAAFRNRTQARPFREWVSWRPATNAST
ncbi:MAG TPA: heparan-alpha-glucosaminide N-acetyltransferase domain-containing protein [Candidatus Acidoferrales bacterium]